VAQIAEALVLRIRKVFATPKADVIAALNLLGTEDNVRAVGCHTESVMALKIVACGMWGNEVHTLFRRVLRLLPIDYATARNADSQHFNPFGLAIDVNRPGKESQAKDTIEAQTTEMDLLISLIHL
jgi:hypothetical protein